MNEDLWNQEDEVSELDALISQIAWEQEATKEEPKSTEPVNFVKPEPEPETEPEPELEADEDFWLTDEELTEMDEAFTEMESKIDTLTSEMDDLQTLSTWYEEALIKLWDHPVLWPLNEKLLRWEELNIPELLQRKHDEELEAMPNLDEANSEGTKPIIKASLQDRLEKWANQMY